MTDIEHVNYMAIKLGGSCKVCNIQVDRFHFERLIDIARKGIEEKEAAAKKDTPS